MSRTSESWKKKTNMYEERNVNSRNKPYKGHTAKTGTPEELQLKDTAGGYILVAEVT